jgi:outer membrane receptor for ferrienterochelin and colicin
MRRVSDKANARIAAAVVAAIASTAARAQAPAGEEELQSVVITGTFIRRSEGFTPASPVAEVNREDFESHNPKTVADFLTELPYSFNTQFAVGRAVGASNGSGSLNLRNLGAGATLVLLNSRRTVRDAVTLTSVDVNALVPQIMIERIEILKDGASSIYGSDAVGGVANFLTRRNFSGFEMVGQGDLREEGSNTDYRLSALWGAQGERGGVVAAIEYFNRSPYDWQDLGLIKDHINDINGQWRLAGWPARYSIPNRNAAGALAGPATTIADPMCAQFSAAAFETGTPVTRQGVSYPSNCLSNTSYGHSYNADETRYQAALEVHYDIAEGHHFFGEAQFLRDRTEIGDNPAAAVNPGPGQPSVIIPGYAPSNTFRATTASGVPLYAQSSGVQLTYDKDGVGGNDFLPARNAAGQVIVAGTDPNAIVGGMPVVPFWEDVTVFNGSRLWGLNCGLVGDPRTTTPCRDYFDPTRYHVDAQRFVTGVEGDLFGSQTWHYTVSGVYAQNSEDDTTFASSFSMPNLRAALAGYGGPGCLTPSNDPLQAGTIRPGSGACQFFNMFGTAITTTPGSPIANTPEVIRYVNAMDWQRFDTTGTTLDLIVSGELFSLPAGKIGIAFGGQHRRDTWSADFPALQNAGQSDLQVAFTDTSAAQTSNALFAEISVPLVKKDNFGALDLTGAIRYENTGGPGLETTDPKVGLLYSTPSGMLALRGTWSTSFLAPTLYQRFRDSAFFANGIDDPLTPGNDNLARLVTTIKGNPALDPQSSENYNLGFTVKPIERLSLDVDYWHFTFDDQIAAENTTQLASNLTTTLDPTKVLRSTSAGTVIYNGVNVGQIVGFDTTYINNAQLETAGIDFGINYANDLGRFGTTRHSLLGTYQTDYKINGVNAERSRNSRVAGASFAVPWRATLRNSWSLGNNSVQSLLRYTDGYANDALPNAGTVAKPFVESYMVWDLSYSYTIGKRFGLESSDVGVGVNNVTNKNPPWVPDVNHVLASMYDYSGRHFWARLRVSF